MHFMRSLALLPLAVASVAFAQTVPAASSADAAPVSSSSVAVVAPVQVQEVAAASSSSAAQFSDQAAPVAAVSSSSDNGIVEVRSFTLLTPLPQAQVDSLRYGPRQKTTFGLHLGLGSVNFVADDDDVDDLDGLTWTAGLVGVFPLSSYVFALQLEAAVTARLVDHAYQQNVTGSSTKVARKDKIQQYNVSVPILFTCRPLNSRIFFLFGPQMDFGVYDHLKIYKDGNKIVNEDLIDDDARENVDWDIVMGLGVKATDHLQFDFRFGAGISDMYGDLYVDGNYWSFTAVTAQMGITLLY